MNWKDSLAYKVSGRNRRQKFDFFMQHFRPTAEMKVLDVGAAEEEYSATDNLIEKLYPYQNNLVVLGVERYDNFHRRYPEARTHVYDGRKFPFADKSFDVVWSNAVIEHVGDFERQVFFLSEIRRVAKNAFLTTPNKHFPVEVHTRTPLLHYLPKPMFELYLHLTGKSWAANGYMFLLSLKDIENLMQQASIERYVIKRNHLFFFTLDFVIMFGEKFET